MAYGKYRRSSKKRYMRKTFKRAGRKMMRKAYRKSLGFGKKASNTMPKIKGKIGIFDNEMYASLSTVDMLQDRMLCFAPIMSGKQLRERDATQPPGSEGTGGLLKGDCFIEAKRICPFLVIRLNCARDPYHSVAMPWDAPFNTATAPYNDAVRIPITDDTSLQTYLDKYRGYINGQPTFSLIEGGEDPTDATSTQGYFYVTNGLSDRLVRPTNQTTVGTGVSTGPMIPYQGHVPQGYVKLAQAFSRCLVYETSLSVTVMNASPIAKRCYDKSKTNPSLRHGCPPNLITESGTNTTNTIYPNFSYHPNADGSYNRSSIYSNVSTPRPTGTDQGDWDYFKTVAVSEETWTPADAEGYYATIGIIPYGPIDYDAVNNPYLPKSFIVNLVMTEDCGSSDCRFVWFGVSVRKNYTSNKQSSSAVNLTGPLAEYPAGIPANLEDHQLGQETTFMLVNITDSAPAATISKTYVIKDWLSTTLTDSQHGFYTAFPTTLISASSANRRAFFPAQGLYAIVWLAPAVRTGTLFAQSIYGVNPYTDAPYSGNGARQGVIPKLGKQVNTGYSDFFCVHSRIDMKCKFYEPRVLNRLQANAAAGDVGSILLNYDPNTA